jgi:hypothetical protein
MRSLKIGILGTGDVGQALGRGLVSLGHTDSGGEQVQRWLPESRVVKAFNIVGHAHMVHPDFPGGPPDMFLCGNDATAKKTVAGICESLRVAGHRHRRHRMLAPAGAPLHPLGPLRHPAQLLEPRLQAPAQVLRPRPRRQARDSISLLRFRRFSTLFT